MAMPLASASEPIAILVSVLLLFVLPLALLTVTVLKGKYGLTVAGFFIPFAWLFGAIRLAKPESWWARNYYGPDKLTAARRRFSTGSAGGAQQPAGWYPDPDGSGLSRLWDGARWTGEYRIPDQGPI